MTVFLVSHRASSNGQQALICMGCQDGAWGPPPFIRGWSKDHAAKIHGDIATYMEPSTPPRYRPTPLDRIGG